MKVTRRNLWWVVGGSMVVVGWSIFRVVQGRRTIETLVLSVPLLLILIWLAIAMTRHPPGAESPSEDSVRKGEQGAQLKWRVAKLALGIVTPLVLIYTTLSAYRSESVWMPLLTGCGTLAAVWMIIVWPLRPRGR